MLPIPFSSQYPYKVIFLTCQALSSSYSLLQDVGSGKFGLKMTKAKSAA